MSLFSLDFALLIFFSSAVYLFIPPTRRWIFLLLLSSFILGAINWIAFGIALTQAALAYFMGRWVAKSRSLIHFWICILVQLSVLLSFKFLGMSKVDSSGGVGRWLVPLGLSFYTFQILAYLIEVRWGRVQPERNFGKLCVYILLFANKVAGPIERPGLLRTFDSIPTPTAEKLLKSACFIWLGLFQKFVIADHLADYVQPVFARPEAYSGLPTTIAVLLSKYQVFCDFSGISLIAIGLGGLFGLELTRNFDRPFAATTLREFWTRWHISLQSWIRDYVFFPLLSTPIGRKGVFPALVVSFLLFALWHDFLWTFAVYGLLQALLVKLEPFRYLRRVPIFVLIVLNYSLLICFPSVLFRVNTLNQAIDIWRNIGMSTANMKYFAELGSGAMALGVFIVLNEVWQWLESRKDIYAYLAKQPWVLKMAICASLLMILVLFSKFDPESVFIYSRF